MQPGKHAQLAAKICHAHAGAKDMSQVPVQWGVHEDVFCAVSTVLIFVISSCHAEARLCKESCFRVARAACKIGSSSPSNVFIVY